MTETEFSHVTKLPMYIILHRRRYRSENITENWCNDSDTEKPKHLECDNAHQKSHGE
jgi:hypothetical protein